MSEFCNDGIIKDELILNIDISDSESWDLNNDLILNNLARWEKQKTSDLNLIDYGLTMYDVAFVNHLHDCYFISSDDKLSFKRVGEVINNSSDYNNYNINPTIDDLIGNYFNFNGGYLQTFFKLNGYNYEMLPARYMKGVTIEYMININTNTHGIFGYFGVRSEDKYNEKFEDESDIINSVGDALDAYIDEEVLSDSFDNYEVNKYKKLKQKKEQIENIKQNQIAFEILNNKKIKISYLNKEGLINEFISPKELNNGWHLLSFVYEPYMELPEYDDKYYCYCRRLGDLKVYSNGSLIWKIKNFEEFYFNKIYNTREKQIGVPFNIMLGGGSFGLKNSKHYNKITQLYKCDDIIDFNNNFIVDGDVLISQISDYINLNVNSGNNIIIQTENSINLLSGHTYSIKAKIRHDGIFHNMIDNGELFVSIETNNENINYIDSYIVNDIDNLEWNEINIKFNTPKDCGVYYFIPTINIKSEIGLISNKNINIKDISIELTNDVVEDETKNNLTIERYFDKPFYGDIQKMRVYNKTLNTGEIIKNAIAEFKNTNYNVTINKGGRLIFN